MRKAYATKPEYIEAEQFFRTMEVWPSLVQVPHNPEQAHAQGIAGYVWNIYGDIPVHDGDWIVYRGDEHGVRSDVVFQKTYQEVQEG